MYTQVEIKYDKIAKLNFAIISFVFKSGNVRKMKDDLCDIQDKARIYVKPDNKYKDSTASDTCLFGTVIDIS